MAGHALTNRVANPVLLRLLRGPVGRRLGRSLAALRYTGRRTGNAHDLVCQYVRSGTTVWVLVGRAGDKTWWRNLREPADVELWLAGEHRRARAVAVVGAEDPEQARVGLETYLAALPAARRSLHLTTGAPVADAVPRVTMVRADLLG